MVVVVMVMTMMVVVVMMIVSCVVRVTGGHRWQRVARWARDWRTPLAAGRGGGRGPRDWRTPLEAGRAWSA